MTATTSDQSLEVASETPQASGPRRRRRPLVLIAALVVAAAAGGLWLVASHRTQATGVAPSRAPSASQVAAAQQPGTSSDTTTHRTGSQGVTVVPVPSYFTGPNPFVPGISQPSGATTGGAPAGG